MTGAAGALAYRMARGRSSASHAKIQVLRGEEILAGPYPKHFGEFVGQPIARAQILAAIKSAALRGNTRMDHMLLASGTPGIGKTTLGRLAASIRDVGFVELGGTVTDKDAINALRAMQDKDVLFLDEIHRLVSRGSAKAEWLLTLLQDGTIQMPTGVFKAPDITVIAATTDAQKLRETIVGRFPIRPVLSAYTEAEAVQIAAHMARRLEFGTLVPMPKATGWLAGVAKACGNNPRLMGDLLTAVRDVALSTDNGNLTKNGYDLTTALEWNGLTEDGLTKVAQEYLVGLFTYGGTAGASTIKALLNEEQLAHTEKLLVQKGYIEIRPAGRVLTDFGMERAAALAEEFINQIEEESE